METAMTMEAAGMMTLKQAKRYMVALETKLHVVDKFICSTNNFYKTTTVHLRKKYNPDAEDETVIVPKKNNMICTPMEVVAYTEDLLWELKKLMAAMEEARGTMRVEFENPLFLENDDMYHMMQKALKTLVDFEEKTADTKYPEIRIPDFLKNSNKRNGSMPVPPPPSFPASRSPLLPYPRMSTYGNLWESQGMRTDYKLNADGEQITYYYKVECKQEPEFEKAEVKAVLEKYQDKVRRLTDLSRQKEQEMQIFYTVKYPEKNTLEEDLRLFLSEK